MKKRVLAILLSLALFLTLLPVSALAEDVLPAAKNGVITLDKNYSVATLAMNMTYDLQGNTLTYTAPSSLTVNTNETFTIKDTSVTGDQRGGTFKIAGISKSTQAAVNVKTKGTVNVSHIKVDCKCTAFYPQGDAAAVNVTNSDVKAGCYCVATNALTLDNYGVAITLNGSTFTAEQASGDNCPVMINVEGTLTIDDCEINGQRQGVAVRAGTAAITNSKITTTGTYANASSQYHSGNWGSGNEIPASALTVGNYVNGTTTTYAENALVTLTNTAVTGTANVPAIYVDANQSFKADVSISGDETKVIGEVTKGQYTANPAQVAIKVAGGSFASPVKKEYLSGKAAELYDAQKNPDAPYSYYDTVGNAAAAASGEGVVKDLNPAPGGTEHTLTLKFGYDNKQVVLTGAAFTLPTPTHSGDDFLGWYYDDETKLDGNAIALSQDTVLTAKWETLPAASENPNFSTTTTETAPDGTVTATTTWSNGQQAVVVKSPEGDKTITVTTIAGEKVADVKLSAEPAAAKKFEDVKAGAWYEKAVGTATGYNLFSGTTKTQFSPNAPMTRGMLATVLYNLSGRPEYGTDVEAFNDVETGRWYADPVDWAYGAGVTSGTGASEFSPNMGITREQLVTMLYRYAKTIGSDSDIRVELTDFPDESKIARYAQDAMRWAVAEGFIFGRANGGQNYIAPQGAASRAEVAVILARFVEYLKK